MTIHIGTSGWSYDHWVGILYPRNASSLERLDHYIQRFQTVEVNNTFYRWPKDETFDIWRQRVPASFLLSIKASRGLTQFRKLNEPEQWLTRMAAGLKHLRGAMGVWLFQLPPHFPVDLERLEHTLGLIPAGFKTAFEFRHPSWHTEPVLAILERHRAAYCVVSGLGQPCLLRATAPFVYVRFHGPDDRRYHGSYPDEALQEWASRLRTWSDEGREVFSYFNNDVGGHAVHNAETLQKLIRASRSVPDRGL
jgi:uncharacterized protein YecE (DUF72 family)